MWVVGVVGKSVSFPDFARATSVHLLKTRYFTSRGVFSGGQAGHKRWIYLGFEWLGNRIRRWF